MTTIRKVPLVLAALPAADVGAMAAAFSALAVIESTCVASPAFVALPVFAPRPGA